MRSPPQELKRRRPTRSSFSTTTNTTRTFLVTKDREDIIQVKHNIIYHTGVRRWHNSTDFALTLIFFSGDNLFAPFLFFWGEIFGREKICFLSSREYMWRVYVFNGVLIYFGSYLSHYFPDFPLFRIFSFY